MDYHDMLARQGVGSAHPGGFAATVDFLSHFPFRRSSRILEVGCGTGRTACYLARKGHEVTGIDIRPAMLKKAKKRAELEQVNVRFLQGDACQLPFESEQFDVVVAESVTVFVDAPKAFSEYYRVLRQSGSLYDREMMAIDSLPSKVSRAVRQLYGARQLPRLAEWMDMLQKAHFQEVSVWKPTAVPEKLDMTDEWAYPDPHQQMDLDVYEDPRVRSILEQNMQIMTRYARYLGYGVLMGRRLPLA